GHGPVRPGPGVRPDGVLRPLRGDPARADHEPPIARGRDRPAGTRAGHLLREQAAVPQGAGPVRAVRHVPARGVAAPAGQHAVPHRLRQQHRGPLPQAPLPALLRVLRLCRRVRVRVRQPASVQPLIGASGAIAGVLGAYLAIYPRAKVWSLLPFLFFIPVRIPAWLVLGSWFVLQWLYSAGYAASGAGDVAYLAHVFGFLAGLVIGLMVRAASAPTQYPVHPRHS